MICTPAPTVPEVIRQFGEAGVPAAVVISAGFRETGPAGRELERELAAQAARFDGLRILGPNCLGLIVPRLGLNASFSDGMPAAGEIAFVTQSGALATAVIDYLTRDRLTRSLVL